ncbi:hypothetical protein KIL84_008637 [Mauremys mutica]|uniref:Uncharacterized protein n=1 Tax=Mauremys mutica TaxID=74926 RepID=A0A9D4AZJ8_9SAUR|nr:hypothetical protein KIL84_008637 [Mauremys mutica]
MVMLMQQSVFNKSIRCVIFLLNNVTFKANWSLFFKQNDRISGYGVGKRDASRKILCLKVKSCNPYSDDLVSKYGNIWPSGRKSSQKNSRELGTKHCFMD